MRKVLCSFASGPHAALLEIARPTFEQYAARHGYDLSLQTVPSDTHALIAPEPDPDGRYARTCRQAIEWGLNHMPISSRMSWTRRPGSLAGRLVDWNLDVCLRLLTWTLQLAEPAAWAKVALIDSLLDQYDLVFWIDADAIIVDLTVDIATFLQPDKWLYGVEHETHEGAHFNAGVMMIRGGPAAKAFLAAVSKRRQYMTHIWWEQAAMLHLLGYDLWPVGKVRRTRFSEGFSKLDKCWNSILFDPSSTPVIKHFAGVDHRTRVAAMSEEFQRFQNAYGPGGDGG